MAGERLAPAMQAAETKKPGIFKRSALWVGEKSTYVTFPISGVIFLAGAASASTALMALGGVGMGVDVVQNRVFKNWRNKEAGGSAETRSGPRTLFSRRRRGAAQPA